MVVSGFLSIDFYFYCTVVRECGRYDFGVSEIAEDDFMADCVVFRVYSTCI